MCEVIEILILLEIGLLVVGEMMMNIELHKVEEDFQVYRYENGYMLDIGTRDEEQNWKRKKIICNTTDELHELIDQVLRTPLAD